MSVITIPKEIIKNDDLIIISRKEYEKLLGLKLKNFKLPSKQKKTNRIYKKNDEFYAGLDNELKEALKEYKAGKYYGPFKNLEEGVQFLESRKTMKLKK